MTGMLVALTTSHSLLGITLPEPPGPYLAMLGAGFVIGIWGHGARLPIAVAIGIALVFVTTLLLFLASQDLNERPLPLV
jgi:hypothetical protein